MNSASIPTALRGEVSTDSMWAVERSGPGRVKLVQHPRKTEELAPGQVRLRFLAGGLCGSDMPPLHGSTVDSVSGVHDGAPIHEIIGEVVESAGARLRAGDRVVGTGGSRGGLEEYLVEDESTFITVPQSLDDVQAVTIQSLGTVLRAAERLHAAGSHVAILGAGPIGLTFAHVLRTRGARRVDIVDPVPRQEIAQAFGADEVVCATAEEWAEGLTAGDRPEIVVEAVGHQSGTLGDALRAVADHGHVLGFGAAEDDNYSLPYREMYERDLTLSSGRTRSGWIGVLEKGRDHLLAHPDDFGPYVSHVLPVEQAQRAYDLYSRPQPGRLKVVLTTI